MRVHGELRVLRERAQRLLFEEQALVLREVVEERVLEDEEPAADEPVGTLGFSLNSATTGPSTCISP